MPGAPLTEMLAEVAREPVTRRVPLIGLSKPEIGQYIALTASEIASPELVARLHEQTDGNPLFVGETVRLLSLEGVPPRQGGAVRLAVPQSIRDVIIRRLAHLSNECNHILVLASALGREFTLETLAHSAASPRMSCSTRSTRRWRLTLSPKCPPPRTPPVRACADARHALRRTLASTPNSPPQDGRHHARGAIRRRFRTAPGRARAPRPRRRGPRAKASATRGVPGTGRWPCLPTRKPNGFTGRRSRRSSERRGRTTHAL